MRESAERAGSSTCSIRFHLCPHSSPHLDLLAHSITRVNINRRQLMLPKTSEGKKTESKMDFLNYAHMQCKLQYNHPGALSCPCLYFLTTHLLASAFKILTFHCGTSSSCFQKGSDFGCASCSFSSVSSEQKHPTDENYTGCSAAG